MLPYDPDPVLDPLFHEEKERRRAATAKEQRERDALLLAARRILGTENGLRLFSWLINETGVFAASFTGNSTTFFLEGKRSVGLALYRLLMTADPEALPKLIHFKRNEENHANP